MTWFLTFLLSGAHPVQQEGQVERRRQCSTCVSQVKSLSVGAAVAPGPGSMASSAAIFSEMTSVCEAIVDC